MKRKYAGMYYSVNKTDKGFVWNLFFNYRDKKPCQTSLENDDEDDKYLDTETAARGDAIDAIQDYYS